MTKDTKKRIIIIVQARMGSTRLPGKILKTILGKPLLGYLIERLQRVSLADKIIIATTTNESDNTIVDFCQKEGVSVFRGSEEDVLSRYYLSAEENQADVVVRITSDCPLSDPKLIDSCIQFFLDNTHQYDYVSNSIERTYPRGFDVEVFSSGALWKAHKLAFSASDREHVTLFMYKNPKQFRVGSIKQGKDLSEYRLTVDTPEDFELIRLILESLYPKNPNFNLEDVTKILEEQPEWVKINAHIQQKTT